MNAYTQTNINILADLAAKMLYEGIKKKGIKPFKADTEGLYLDGLFMLSPINGADLFSKDEPFPELDLENINAAIRTLNRHYWLVVYITNTKDYYCSLYHNNKLANTWLICQS